MKSTNAIKFNRKSGGAQWRDLLWLFPVLMHPKLCCNLIFQRFRIVKYSALRHIYPEQR
jgi:hypothetical protein